MGWLRQSKRPAWLRGLATRAGASEKGKRACVGKAGSPADTLWCASSMALGFRFWSRLCSSEFEYDRFFYKIFTKNCATGLLDPNLAQTMTVLDRVFV